MYILFYNEKVIENLDRKIYKAPIPTPIAKWSPIPPLTFLAATAKPINVKIRIVNGSAVLLCNSVSYFFKFPFPFWGRKLELEFPLSNKHLKL